MATTSWGRSRRHALLLATTVLMSGLAAPSYATSPHPNLDANGVDLTEGGFNLQLPIASIGSGQTRLDLIQHDGSRDNYNTLYAYRTVSGGVTTITITLGLAFDTFKSTDGFAQSTRGTGATLTINSDESINYRTLEGVSIVLTNPVGAGSFGGSSNLCDVNNTANCFYLAQSVSGRSGMSVDFTWDVYSNCSEQVNPDDPINCTHSWRLQNVHNDAAYAIDWTFASNYTYPNPGPDWYRRTSAVLSNANASSSSWPTVAYGAPSSTVTTITTPGGKTWRLTASGSNVGAVRRPSASSDTMTISYSGSKVSSVTKDGVTTGYNYSVSGSTATMVVTNALSQTTTIVSDLNKFRPTSVTDALSNVTSMTYDSIGRPTEISYPEGNKVQYLYDTRGNVTTVTKVAKSGSGLLDIVTKADYDITCSNIATCNQPNWTEDALGNRTNYTYDSTTGLITSAKLPAASGGANRPETRYTYTTTSGVSLLTGVSTCQTGVAPGCVGTADEVKTTTSYNSNMLPSSVSTGAGDASLTATNAYTYDAIGNRTYVDGPLSGSADTTRTLYSADREVVGAISADPDGGGSLPNRAQRVTYNSDGQPTVIERGTTAGQSDSAWSGFSAAEKVTSTYDGNARKTKDVLANGGTDYGVTQYSYDAVGRTECSTVRMNSAVWSSLPSSACTVGTAGSYGADRISKTTYDAVGRVSKVQSAYGQTEQADDATVTFNANGTTATATDGEGHLTTYEYDGFDRLKKTRYPLLPSGTTSSTTDYEGLTYDANGNVTQRRLRDNQTISYAYDNLNRMTDKDRPTGSWDYSYTYDLLGRLTSGTIGNGYGWTFSFGYDALSRKTSETRNQYATGNLTNTYDLAGRRTRTTWSDGFYADYDYLVTGEVSAIRENGATSGIGVLGSYAYDGLGRMTTLTRGNGVATSYGHDAVSRLSSLAHDLASTANDVTTTFTYNPAGQIASSTRDNDTYAWNGHSNRDLTETPNGLNQLVSQGATSFGYDGRGNLTSAGSNTYAYSYENELVASSAGSGGQADDPFGRIFNEVISGGASTVFQNDGSALSTELNAVGATILRRYVYGPGTDNPLVV